MKHILRILKTDIIYLNADWRRSPFTYILVITIFAGSCFFSLGELEPDKISGPSISNLFIFYVTIYLIVFLIADNISIDLYKLVKLYSLLPIPRKEIGWYRIVKPMIVFLVPVILIIIFVNIFPHDKNSNALFFYRNPGLLLLYLPLILGTRLGQDNNQWLGGLSMVCAYLLLVLSANLDHIVEHHDYLSVQIATHPIVILTLSILIIRLLYKSYMNRDSYLFNEPRGGSYVEDS